MIVETAPAKINLYLHVGPIREDRLHTLESLFFFSNSGDTITVEDADTFSLEIDGPFSPALMNEPVADNLVLRAANILKNSLGQKNCAKIKLQKNLPVAAGIGGGSADAAATLRALLKLWNEEINPSTLHKLAFSLGADVPACLNTQPKSVSGSGEIIKIASTFPKIAICLVNPGVETLTGPIFKAFDAAVPSPEMPISPWLNDNLTIDDLQRIIGKTKNDLQIHAINNTPVIGEVIDFLASWPMAIGTRMSGSGATCFALLESKEDAEKIAIQAQANGWWAAAMEMATSS